MTISPCHDSAAVLDSPYVDFFVVGFFVDDFGAHPVRSAHRRLPHGFAREMRAKAEVGEFDSSVHAEQHVVAFYVAVHDVVLVEVA